MKAVRLLSAVSLVLLGMLCFASPVQAWVHLGAGNGSLLSGDLTDPNDEIVDRGSYSGDLPEEQLKPDNAGWLKMKSAPNNPPGTPPHQRHAYQSWVDTPACSIFLNNPEKRKWYVAFKDGGGGGPTQQAPYYAAVQFAVPYYLTHFSLTTAPDMPGRDPKAWAIQGSNTGKDDDWTDIYRCDAKDRSGTALREARAETAIFTSFTSANMAVFATPAGKLQPGEVKKIEAKLKGQKIEKADFAAPAKPYTWFRLVVYSCFNPNTMDVPNPAEPAGIALGQMELFGVSTVKSEAKEAALADDPNRPNLLPLPKAITMGQGRLPLSAQSRIVASEASLEPLARLLADEIATATGLTLATARGPSQPGDIVLKITPQLQAGADILAVQKQKVAPTRDFAHAITVSDRALVEGWDYRAVCEGTATLLQALGEDGGKWSIPRMTIKDWPQADFTGVMVDCARQEIPIDALKAVVEACRFWKIRYCHLHLSDDEGFVFPSKAFPKLGTKNEAAHGGVVPRVYDIEELKALVAYADARGVTLVPELETPGHSEAMCRAMPEVFAGPKVMNIASDKMYDSLDTLVGEMCDVFKSSPYFHIGGEENYFYELEELPETAEYLKKTGLKNFRELTIQHVRRMNEIVKRHGKRTLVWEGMPLDPATLKDEVIVMCWTPWPTATELQKQGFTTITVPWDLGVAPAQWNLYHCNGSRLDPATNRVLGSSQTMWMMSASALVGDFLGGDVEGSSCEGYIRSLADRAERTWGPTNKAIGVDYQQRLAATRMLLEKRLFPATIQTKGAATPSWPVLGRMRIRDSVEVTLSASGTPGGKIHFTLDGSEPTAQSPAYESPITLESSARLHAAVFSGGRQVGRVSRATFEAPVKVAKPEAGKVEKIQPRAEQPIAVSKSPEKPNILPTPKSIALDGGVLPLTAATRIVVADPQLDDHAAVLAEEIWLLTGLKPKIAKGEAGAGDILLKINPEIRADENIMAVQNQKVVRTRDMGHTISVTDRAVVEGWDHSAVCEGTATLIQSLGGKKGSYYFPKMKVKDWPHADYTGTMVDCGRQWIPADALKALVVSCRQFKVRYIQLHVGDDQGYSFPSKAFPKLATQNGSCCGGIPPKRWTFQEMKELEAWAYARGVRIVPELETPGHHQAMGRCYRDVFDGPGCMDMASEELYKGLDTVVREMCEVFKSSPYFHIGCDEANWGGVGAGPWAQIYKRRHTIPGDNHGVRNAWEIYVVHVKRMSDIVRKYGKVPIAWENFPNDNRLKDDVIAMIWYPNAVAHRYQQAGWTTITVPWELRVPFEQWNIYHCNGSRLQRTDRVLGGSRPMWQMSALCLTSGWMQGVGERQERTWGPDTPIDMKEYRPRLKACQERVSRLAMPAKMVLEGPTMGMTYFLGCQVAFSKKLKVRFEIDGPTEGEVRYTLDGSEPTATSTLYTQPLVMDKSFVIHAAMFLGGKQVGCVTRGRYDWVDTEGFVEDWMVAGPYMVAGKSGLDIFDVPFDPEKGGQVNWIRYKPTISPPWLVNLCPLPGFAGENRAGYLRTKVWSPKAQQALLLVHSDDAVKVWLNGKVVHNQNKGRYANEEDRISVNFREGWNEIMMKVINWGGEWQAQARVRAANGGAFEGLKTQAQ